MACISYFIPLVPENHEIHIAFMNHIGVDSFIEHENALEAFIELQEDQQIINEIESYLLENKLNFEKKIHIVKDWNLEWESNFKVYSIHKKLIVRAPFHPQEDGYETDLIIFPKMAFGTGHHETTSMILEWMVDQTFEHLKVLDFGCGTGILGIYAAKKGADVICLIDNDPLSIDNTNENILLNDIQNAMPILGTHQSIPGVSYDFIFANITRNILVESMETLSSNLSHQGVLVLSGFLKSDQHVMLTTLALHNLKIIELKQKGDWLCIIAGLQ